MLAMVLPMLWAGGSGAPAQCAFDGPADIVLDSSRIRASDLAGSGQCLNIPDQGADITLATLPPEAGQYELSCAQFLLLMRRRYPALVVTCADREEAVRFRMQPAMRQDFDDPLTDLRCADCPAAPPPERDVPVGHAGDVVYGVAGSGPVRIEREFKLLQPAWPGRDVFARDERGDVIVLSVPLHEGSGGEE